MCMCMAQFYAELLRQADREDSQPSTWLRHVDLPGEDSAPSAPADYLSRTARTARSLTAGKPWYKMDFPWFR